MIVKARTTNSASSMNFFTSPPRCFWNDCLQQAFEAWRRFGKRALDNTRGCVGILPNGFLRAVAECVTARRLEQMIQRFE